MGDRILHASALASMLAVLHVASGCDRIKALLDDQPKAEVESYVDEPYTLAALRERAKATGGRFEQHERDDRSGSACHSAVCLIIAPFVLIGALFPERWIEAKVAGGEGAPSYHGTFQLDGSLISMKVAHAGLERELALLDLAGLGRKVLVEVARRPPPGVTVAAVDSSGEVPWPRTPIVAQVDLRPAYAAAASRLKDAEKKSDLLVEALAVLGDDALPLLRSELRAGAPQREPALGDLVSLACSPANQKVSRAGAETLFALAAQGSTHVTAHVALACARRWPIELPAAQASGLVRQLVAGYCGGSFRFLMFENYGWFAEAVSEHASASLADAVLAKCGDPVHRAGLRFAFDLPGERAELEALFRSKHRDAKQILEYVECPWPALDEPVVLEPSFACVQKRAAELAEIAARAGEYAQAVSGRDLATASALLATLYDRAVGHHHQRDNDAAATRAARAVLERARARTAPGDAAALGFGLYCLGEPQHAGAIELARAAKDAFAAALAAKAPDCSVGLHP
jgi:hypothetical protein